MRERFIRTGKYQGCYKLGDIIDRKKDRRVCSVQMPDLNGEPYLLDLLNQLNNENQEIKNKINKIIQEKLKEIENNPNVSLIPREATMILHELQKEIQEL